MKYGRIYTNFETVPAEKLGIVDSSKEWFELRELRNAVNHDYSLLEEELVETINRI